nr:TonB-dependent receptor [Sphingomonas jatrophae]
MLATALLGLSAAEAPPPAAPHDRQAPGDFHEQEAQTIVITAPLRTELGSALAGTTVLSGTDLARELRPTIGDTLARQPGVSSTSFGPNASRPVLRGFQGDRIRILTDGIGSFDASTASVDHAVAINPLTAERVEVLRGPTALLFGSSAIGGVVNVIDSRIPRRLPDEAIHVDALGTLASAADERSIGAAADAPLGGGLVLHVDGSYLKTDDLDTGGYILSRPLRAQAAASAEPEIAELADLKGKLPNSAARTWDVAGALAYVAPGVNIGASVTRYDSLYGVPVRYSLDPAIEAEAPRIDLRQTRYDLRAEVDTGGDILQAVRFRAGHADYRHDELEETGEIGTSFFSEGSEGRLELVQAKRGGWSGAVGAQALRRKFRVRGEEKFVPDNLTEQYGLFTLQQIEAGAWRAEAGARYEHTLTKADADEQIGNPDLRRRFDTFSGSLGASYAVVPGWRIGLNATHSERAPSTEELYANGPHAGTQAFEVGDPTLRKERSNGLEATLRGRGQGYTFDVSAYWTRFKNYIYEAQTGEIEDDLPVFQQRQGRARYLGFEVEGSLDLAKVGDWTFVADGLADYVKARIRSVGPAPRIPPLRLLGGLEAQSDALVGRIEAEWSDRQDRVSAFETETPSFTLVNASVAWHPLPGNRATTLTLSANNLFDVVARRHASFLKDYAPLAGRDFRLSARFSL